MEDVSVPNLASLLTRGLDIPAGVGRPISPPLQLSSVYKIDDLDQIDGLIDGRLPGFFYARDGQPNSTQLAAKIALMEGAEGATICSSGMAAIAATILSIISQGDSLAIADGLYGKTITLIAGELSRFGVEHTTFDASRPETLVDRISHKTRLILAETISNPLLRIADLHSLGQIARDARIPLVIDHTFAPLLCRPIDLGATLVIHSVTKLIGGHSDLTQGVVAGTGSLIARIRVVASTFGQAGNPFESWLAMRGMSTLALRVERSGATALELARRLESHPKVLRVYYPGLESHSDSNLARRLFPNGYGAMVSFDLGSRDRANGLIKALRHIPFAPSLGDVQTTLSHPGSTSHRNQAQDRLDLLGITPGLIRLSVGLEDVEDLWSDFRTAIGAIQ